MYLQIFKNSSKPLYHCITTCFSSIIGAGDFPVGFDSLFAERRVAFKPIFEIRFVRFARESVPPLNSHPVLGYGGSASRDPADKSSLMDLSKRVSLSGITKFVPSRENVAIKTCLNVSPIVPDSGSITSEQWTKSTQNFSLVDFTVNCEMTQYVRYIFHILYKYIFSY